MTWFNDREMDANDKLLSPKLVAKQAPTTKKPDHERSSVGRCRRRKEGDSMMGSRARNEKPMWQMPRNRGKPKPRVFGVVQAGWREGKECVCVCIGREGVEMQLPLLTTIDPLLLQCHPHCCSP